MGWFADFVKILNGEVKEPSSRLLYGRLPHVAGWEHDPEPAEPGSRYLRLWVQEMWLKDERVWFDHYSPVVYSTVKLNFGTEVVEIPAVVGEFKLGGLEGLKNMQNVIKLNYPLTNYLPYNGGSVSLSAALVGLRTEQGLRDVIDAVGELSGTLAVPQLSSVTAVAGPVLRVLDSVLGNGDRHLSLGLHQTFSHAGQEELRSGYYLTARCEEGPAVLSKLIVQDGSLCWGEDLRQVTEFDYMLFRLEMTKERTDLEQLRNIFDLVEKAEREAAGGSDEDVDRGRKLLTQAKLAAWQSQDLTKADQSRVPAAIDQRFTDFLRAMGIVGGGAAFDGHGAERVPFGELVAQISPEEALARTESEVLEDVFGD